MDVAYGPRPGDFETLRGALEVCVKDSEWALADIVTGMFRVSEAQIVTVSGKTIVSSFI
jgi:hypothetical protein